MTKMEEIACAMGAARISGATWEEYAIEVRHDLLMMAHAAVTAMREPNEHLKKFETADGNVVIWDAVCYYCGGAEFIWTAMIDAILNEKVSDL